MAVAPDPFLALHCGKTERQPSRLWYRRPGLRRTSDSGVCGERARKHLSVRVSSPGGAWGQASPGDQEGVRRCPEAAPVKMPGTVSCPEQPRLRRAGLTSYSCRKGFPGDPPLLSPTRRVETN